MIYIKPTLTNELSLFLRELSEQIITDDNPDDLLSGVWEGDNDNHQELLFIYNFSEKGILENYLALAFQGGVRCSSDFEISELKTL